MTRQDGIVVAVGALTDVGRAREHNEDSFYAGKTVFAVADGLGGHRAGEVASRIAVDELARLDDARSLTLPDSLVDAIRSANRSVFERQARDPATAGMGTTVTAVALDGPVAHLGHVGDSRCYLLRHDELMLVSHDHTLVARMVDEGTITPEQAETHPQRSIVTRALGADPNVSVDTEAIPLQQGDRLLLCSDGLSSVVPETEIARMVHDGGDVRAVASSLVAEANRRGGPDNITVVLLEIGEKAGSAAVAAAQTTATPRDTAALPTPPAEPKRKRLRDARARRVPRRALLWAIVVLLVVIGGPLTLRAIAFRSYYVGIHGDNVAIFQGWPTDFFVPLNRLARDTGTCLSSVSDPHLRQSISEERIRGSRSVVDRKTASIPSNQPCAASSPTPTPTPSPSPSPGTP